MCLCTLLSLTTGHTELAPVLPTQPNSNPTTAIKNTQAKTKVPHVLSNMTLDYAKGTQDSTEVLNAKVSVTLKDASFLSALDALMNASDKTCRIDCRQLQPFRLPLNIKDVPLGGVLDALAKFGGTRLYVLPNKLILAPEKALTNDEKKTAKLYGLLLTTTTLPNTPQAKALLKPNDSGKTILDIANTKVDVGGGTFLGFPLHGALDPIRVPVSAFTPKIIGPISDADLAGQVKYHFEGVNYADALASFAHSIGRELYLTPDHFIISSPDQLNAPENRQWAQNAVPAFVASSTNISFSDPSVNAS